MESAKRIGQQGRRGRGALSNDNGRFEKFSDQAFDDGWGTLDEPAPPLRTTVTRDMSRTVIARNSSPDVGFDRSINPYRGCEHGCIYCFARPTHAWLGLSPGLDFESRLLIKPDAPALLDKALRRPRYECRPIAMGTNTDPYQPLERKLEITREILKVLDRFNHPVTLLTKSNLIVRDIDILSSMAKRNLVKAALSVTTLDRVLARRMEPRAATPGRRLDAVRALVGAGIPTAVMFAPVIPAINDTEMEDVCAAAADAGAHAAGYILLRLPLEIATLWREWLRAHYPDRENRVMRHLREAHNGRDYDSRFGHRQRGNSAYADLLRQRFELACRRHDLNRRDIHLDCSAFAPPIETGSQLGLF
jgi:DNA repair photolyase